MTASERPKWAARPVPPNVLRTFPDVRTWTWVSPLRLRGESEHGPGAYLVVTAAGPDRPRCVGQAIAPGTSAERVSEIYASLHMLLATDIGHETACLDGAPVRADHDPDRCRFCGLLATEHTEAEAAIYVELEAMKLRAERSDDPDPEAGQ